MSNSTDEVTVNHNLLKIGNRVLKIGGRVLRPWTPPKGTIWYDRNTYDIPVEGLTIPVDIDLPNYDPSSEKCIVIYYELDSGTPAYPSAFGAFVTTEDESVVIPSPPDPYYDILYKDTFHIGHNVTGKDGIVQTRYYTYSNPLTDSYNSSNSTGGGFKRLKLIMKVSEPRTVYFDKRILVDEYWEDWYWKVYVYGWNPDPPTVLPGQQILRSADSSWKTKLTSMYGFSRNYGNIGKVRNIFYAVTDTWDEAILWDIQDPFEYERH